MQLGYDVRCAQYVKVPWIVRSVTRERYRGEMAECIGALLEGCGGPRKRGVAALEVAAIQPPAAGVCQEFPLMILATGVMGSITAGMFLIERWVLADTCLRLGVTDCAGNASVSSEAALWLRWVTMANMGTSLVMILLVGSLSDSLRSSAERTPSSRIPLLLLQIAVTALDQVGLLLIHLLHLPRGWQIGFSMLAGLAGGSWGILPTLFALLADWCPPAHRHGAFIRLELALFLGPALTLQAAGMWL